MAKAKAYSSEVCRRLAGVAEEAQLLRPRKVARHEAGDRLSLDLEGVAPAWRGRATFEILGYVGGGFAGQVYRARVVEVEGDAAARESLPPGGVYALKMFVPWSGFARMFRDAIYGLAFQAPFGLQVSRSAVRAAALWQKFLRRGAGVCLGREDAIVDVHATCFDPALGTHGEVLEWVQGRVWRLEVNERLLSKEVPATGPAETEYAAKKKFMGDIVGLFHEMGAPELARQYEWWTMKSQPNVLKRVGAGPPRGEAAGEDPSAGLVAVDFGAGLALLPFLPMSPGDFKLILQGLVAGRLVQFDRGDLERLEAFVSEHASAFTDLGGALAELRLADTAYRRSQADVTHHHVHLVADRELRRSVREGWIASFQARGRMDAAAERFRSRPMRTWLFVLLGFIPLVGPFLQRVWGNAAYRRHVGAMLTSFGYLGRVLRAKEAECLIEWHRRGRVSAGRAEALLGHPIAFWIQAFALGWLPAGAHRFLTDRRYALDVFKYMAVRPILLFFSRARREAWLREMVEEGRRDGMLKDEEAESILARIKEPYIQAYLLSLVVHLMTLPITQIVSVLLGSYLAAKYGRDAVESGAIFGGTLVVFQVTPISPGSLVRGLYATGLAIAMRDWKNYSWAVCISYWKYIGYLGFPIQMVHSYPILARFMAARWATHGVGLVPVFGEHGALLEHGVFDTFFNAPISLRHRWRELSPQRRALRGPLGWIGTCLGVGHLPGPSGTYASAIGAGLLVAAFYLGAPAWAVVAAAAAATVLAIPVAAWFERRLERKDPRPFVLDELAGMLVAGLAAWLPTNRWAWASLAMAFVWFRVCDVLKPPPARQLERLPGGWGIVMDDIAAGVMALGLAVLSQMVLAHFIDY
jgi:phosphatidylglycerophosphatase A